MDRTTTGFLGCCGPAGLFGRLALVGAAAPQSRGIQLERPAPAKTARDARISDRSREPRTLLAQDPFGPGPLEAARLQRPIAASAVRLQVSHSAFVTAGGRANSSASLSGAGLTRSCGTIRSPSPTISTQHHQRGSNLRRLHARSHASGLIRSPRYVLAACTLAVKVSPARSTVTRSPLRAAPTG